MAEVQLQGNSGPVQPGSIAKQQQKMGGPGGFLNTPSNLTGEAMSGYGAPGAPSTDNSGYYSTGNPFAVAPVEQDDESGPRRQRYLDDRMSADYGGSGMRSRLMTA